MVKGLLSKDKFFKIFFHQFNHISTGFIGIDPARQQKNILTKISFYGIRILKEEKRINRDVYW